MITNIRLNLNIEYLVDINYITLKAQYMNNYQIN